MHVLDSILTLICCNNNNNNNARSSILRSRYLSLASVLLLSSSLLQGKVHAASSSLHSSTEIEANAQQQQQQDNDDVNYLAAKYDEVKNLNNSTVVSFDPFNQSQAAAAAEAKDEMDGAGKSMVDPSTMQQQQQQCGLWIAPSTIPGAGIGMFAGRDFDKHEPLQQTGDIAVPIVDIVGSQPDGGDWDFLWDEYTWNAMSIRVHPEGVDEINVASEGFGAVANCMLPIINVEEWYCEKDNADLHRSTDPGAGAFTAYHDRKTTAKRALRAGEELFVSYGSNWFTTRPQLGPIPLFDDLRRAQKLVKRFRHLNETLRNHTHVIAAAAADNGEDHSSKVQAMLEDAWDLFVRQTPFKESRVIGSFRHDDPDEMKQLVDPQQQRTLEDLRKQQSTRSMEWLQQHGTCADNTRAGRSTLKQAGRGAFATRNLANGTVVAPVPLIHLLERERLTMYNFTFNAKKRYKRRPEQGVQGYQLLLNYCMGHPESSLLLCPYGPMNMLVNHNRTMANVKLRWADPQRSNHMPELLESDLKRLETDATAKLAMEFVAIRDIQEGEEIFMDYGQEWEDAWTKHVGEWTPVENADDYIGSWQWNHNKSLRLPTVFEMMDDPALRRENLEIKCDSTLMNEGEWREKYKNGTLAEFLQTADGEFWNCEILRYRVTKDGEYLYTIVLTEEEDEEDEDKAVNDYRIEDVPRDVFLVMDKPYTSDMHLPNAFRHDIRVPDELFPLSWRNMRK